MFKVQSAELSKRCAYHESGHVVMGRVLALACGGATIVPDGTGLDGSATVAGHHPIHSDFIASGGYRDFLSSVFLKLMVCLAGP
jgi:ATP-dependent Zn protease